MLHELFGKNKVRFFAFLVIAAMILGGTFSVNAASENWKIELEDQEYTKTDEVFLETPYTHDALPVDGAVNVNYYKAGNLLQTSFTVPKAGIYLITLGYVMNQDAGLLQMKIDETVVGENIDLNNGGAWEAGMKKVGLLNLAEGSHTLSFISQESNYYCAILDFLEFEELTPSDEIIFEFEGNAYTKSGDFHLESIYRHEALPVDAVANVDFYKAGETLETVSLVIPESGKFKIALAYILNNDSCSVQISIDGHSLGDTVNLYHDGGWTLEEKELGEMELAAGIHKITIQSIDNGSGRYCARLDALKLTKIAEAVNPVDPVIPDPGKDPGSQPTSNPSSNPGTKPDTIPSTADTGSWLGFGVTAALILLTMVLRRQRNHESM